ncbi:winged helix-turn-helix domain-containing protein [Haladaptatus pallidirubidus]|uniref:winged helix-turn-helix domain-containing protein n=1 Tax=Haladaptatus pallidirubidus TaxID=1008152 RepID=UPI0035EEF805
MDSAAVEPADEHVRDAFQLLADETRLEILFALWNAPEWTATFTELKDAVGMRDSGQFQYHLNQLAGTFIRQVDDGYTHLAAELHCIERC